MQPTGCRDKMECSYQDFIKLSRGCNRHNASVNSFLIWVRSTSTMDIPSCVIQTLKYDASHHLPVHACRVGQGLQKYQVVPGSGQNFAGAPPRQEHERPALCRGFPGANLKCVGAPLQVKLWLSKDYPVIWASPDCLHARALHKPILLIDGVVNCNGGHKVQADMCSAVWHVLCPTPN